MHLVSCHRDASRQEERERGRGGASLKDNGNYRHHDVMLYSTSSRVPGRICFNVTNRRLRYFRVHTPAYNSTK